MELPIDQTIANQLVAALTPTVRRQLLDLSEYIEVTEPANLQMARGRTAYAYFPTDSVISVLAPVDGRHGLEVGAVGREGLFGAATAVDGRNPELRGSIQAAGHAWRTSAQALEQLMAASAQVQDLVQSYLRVVLTQTARQAVCCRFHTLSQRLARWLLTHADCGATSDVLVTHSALATMLGTHRARVTQACGVFERKQLISSRRGHIVLLDHVGLRAASCSCYEMNRRTYEHGMGALRGLADLGH